MPVAADPTLSPSDAAVAFKWDKLDCARKFNLLARERLDRAARPNQHTRILRRGS